MSTNLPRVGNVVRTSAFTVERDLGDETEHEEIEGHP
jgi:hypothetical protein